jgi:UDP-N-acetylmuramoylalanine--D-glutamate ligase
MTTESTMAEHSIIRDLRDLPVTVIGAARSGVGVAKLLAFVGARVFVSDNGGHAGVRMYTDELNRFAIPFETGKHTERVYDAGLMVLSPGVPSDAAVVLEARKRGITVVSELEVASWYCRVPVIAVTGTYGKTTTAILIGRMLHDAKRLHILAGNIGDAFSNHAAQLNSNSLAVVEVSSFQLDHVERFKPNVSVILNIRPVTLHRYGNSIDEYVTSIARVFTNQDKDDVLIYNADDPIVAELIKKARSRTYGFSIEHTLDEGAYLEDGILTIRIGGKKQSLIQTEKMRVNDVHQISNVMAAGLAVSAFGVPVETLKQTLSTL